MYLLDTNVFLQAYQILYPPDVFPGFWEWMEKIVTHPNVATVDEVISETSKKDDEIAQWINNHVPDQSVFNTKTYRHTSLRNHLFEIAKNLRKSSPGRMKKFEKGADSWLIAHAKINNDIIVTQEIAEDKKNIKIQDICREINVDVINILEFIRDFDLVMLTDQRCYDKLESSKESELLSQALDSGDPYDEEWFDEDI